MADRFEELMESVKVVLSEKRNWDLKVLNHRLDKISATLKDHEDGHAELESPELEKLIEQYGYYKGKIEMLQEILDELEYVLDNNKGFDINPEIQKMQEAIDEYLKKEKELDETWTKSWEENEWRMHNPTAEIKEGDKFEINGKTYKLERIIQRSTKDDLYFLLYDEKNNDYLFMDSKEFVSKAKKL